jgi:hypothetical protein
VDELKLTVPTYYGRANCVREIVGEPPDFDTPDVPVLIHEAGGIRIVLGTHDFNDMSKPDIQIERRPKGWAIFLHPIGGGDPSGYVYFLDDGRSLLLRENTYSESGSIEVLPDDAEEPTEIDEIDDPQPIVREGRPSPDVVQDRCARCGQLSERSEDWYDNLCPSCADQTDGQWICRVCGRRGTFESMGGDGITDPDCRHVASD